MDVSICQGNPHLKQPLSSVKKNTIIINVETSIVINLQIPIIINMSVPDILKIIWDIYFLFLRRASKKKKIFLHFYNCLCFRLSLLSILSALSLLKSLSHLSVSPFHLYPTNLFTESVHTSTPSLVHLFTSLTLRISTP